MPGAPPSAAAAMPESSAKTGLPVASAAAFALISALASNESPVSGGSSMPAGSSTTVCGGLRMRANSSSLCALRLASISSMSPFCLPGEGGAHSFALGLAELGDAGLGECEQVVERRARERRALRGRLNLDEAAVAGHDDVGVDLGGRVLGVVQVEQRPAAD